MSRPRVAVEFWEMLRRSKLLSASQIALAEKSISRDDIDGPLDIAHRLVRDNQLTKFQAEQLLNGQHRGFFYDDYKILDILGAGGMGRLYRAQDLRSGQEVALKLLYEAGESADPGVRARFDLEARAGSMLHHPNLVQMLKLHRSGHATYIVMELIEGISLQEHVVLHGRMPWAHLCDVIRQAACGLQHAHDKGLVHRDVKPSNLLITHAGDVKVLDFGLARIAEDEFSMAHIFGQNRVGTADYVAPEQSIDSYKVDHRADVYSLGCTMYFGLTGVVPFAFKSVSKTIEAHRTRRPRPVQELAADVPAEVVAIVDQMIRKRPEKRFSQMRELAAALAPYCQHKPLEFDYQRLTKIRSAYARRRIKEHESRQQKQDEAKRTTGSLESGSSLINSGLSRLNRAESNFDFDLKVPGSSHGTEIKHGKTGAVLHNAPSPSLVGANLRDASLAGAGLSGADLSNADLSNADLRQAQLRGIRLINAKLNGVLFDGADLTGADLSGAELDNASVRGCNLAGAQLSQIRLRYAQVLGSDLIGADLRNSDLSMSQLQSDFTNANLTRCNLTNTDLTGATFNGANLEGANLTGAKMDSATLRGAKLTGAISPLGKPFAPTPSTREGSWKKFFG